MTEVQNLTLLAAIFTTAAFLASCGEHSFTTNSFVDGSGDGGEDIVSGDVLGSCMGIDRGNAACVEIFNLSDAWNLSAARENCAQNNGAWSTGSACPAWHIDFEYAIDSSGVIYYYPDPVALPSSAAQLAAGQKEEGSIAELYGEAWYKFTAVAGASYHFSWDDLYSGEASDDMADVAIDMYSGNGDLIFRGDDMADVPPVIALESGGLVYVRVTRISEKGGSAFRIMYN